MSSKSHASLPLIDDAGEFIPHARKHVAAATGPQRQDSLRLDELFPEPDWNGMISAGRPLDCVAYLAVLYWSLPAAPRADGVFRLPGRVWEIAYADAIRALRQFFGQAESLRQAQGVAAWMAARFNETPTSITKRPVGQVASYWAASPGGTKRLRPLGSFTLRQHQLASWMHLLGWPASDAAIRTNISPASTRSGTYLVIEVVGERCRAIATDLPSRDVALLRARQEIARVAAASAVAGKKAAVSGTVERIGPPLDPRGSESPEALMRLFRLRGVQFGESLSQPQRQKWLCDLHAGLCDLQSVLAMPHRWMGLGGIAVAAAARGKGPAAAHYEPALRVVNFTRDKGAGALAHEWWHAMDHRLARRFRSASLIEMIPNIQDRHLQALKQHDPAFASLFEAILPIFVELRAALRAGDMMRQARRIEALPRARKGYWVTMSEMSARAFEAWVEDQIAKRGHCSPYLVYGTTQDTDIDNTPLEESISMYPHGIERRTLGLLYTELFAELGAATASASSASS